MSVVEYSEGSPQRDPHLEVVMFVDYTMNERFNPSAIRAWAKMLQEHCPDAGALRVAVKALAARWASPFPPPLGAIIEAYNQGGSDESEAAAEWADLLGQVSSRGHMQGAVYPSERSREALRQAVGGFRPLCETQTDRLDRVRSAFLKAWRGQA